MRIRLLVCLLGLRYRLMWAQARLQAGRVALVVVGVLLVCLVAAMLALGGLGAAVEAVRLGKGELVAAIVLSTFFVFALFGALILGAGINPTFSDAALRRYPLSSFERLGARHLVGPLEPLWIFVLALDLGLAIGFAALGVSSCWVALPAALLLLSTNYLAVRLLLRVVEHIMATRNGPLLLMGLVVLLFQLPGLLAPALAHNRALSGNAWIVLRFLPPFTAARVVAGAPAFVTIASMLLLVGWCAGLIAALAWVERQPLPSRTVAGAEAHWDSSCDRIAAAFGPVLAPLVGKTLRYYVRSPQLKMNYPLIVPMVLFIAFTFARGRPDPLAGFLTILALISILGFLSMGIMPMNVFGFDGSGFRRYFLLPAPPGLVLRAVAFVPLLLGAPLILVCMGLWLVIWPGHLDGRMAVMLLSSGFGGMFLFQALGLWTSLLAPQAMEFKVKFGAKQPLATTALMMSGMGVMFGLVAGLPALGSKVVLGHWWVAPLILLAALGFYLLTLRGGARVFGSRRERMLSMIERGL